MTCAKCGLDIKSGTDINGLLVCDWCKPKKSDIRVEYEIICIHKNSQNDLKSLMILMGRESK